MISQVFHNLRKEREGEKQEENRSTV